MPLSSKLEIILVTYNREKYLSKTLSQLFAENSPIKDFSIIILDNKSTDGTADVIKLYQEKFPNLKHIIHNRNIGGNANIFRAFEIASNDYLWVLCDDDEFDFTHWLDVENAIKENYDAIIVSNYNNPQKNIAQLVGQMTFVPSTIYKTKYFTDTVMSNAAFSIADMFPHMAFAANLINDNLRIKILDNWIVKMIVNPNSSFTRGLDDNKHPIMTNKTWQTGFINALQMIKSDDLKKEIIENYQMPNDSYFFLEKKYFTKYNITHGKNSTWNLASTYSHYARLYNENSIMIEITDNETSGKKIWCELFITNFRCVLAFGKYRLTLWDTRLFRFYKAGNGIYCQLGIKLKFKIFPFKKRT